MRTFEDKPAKRESTPVFCGLVGPSSSGKTYSALRVATGIQRITGGDIFGVDTESKRMLHYADKFKFRHVAFGAPFSPLDYLAVVEHCTRKGAKVVIIDSMSHEHEGPGGVLEMQEAELQRIAGDDWKKRQRCAALAWVKPKAARQRFINTLLQLGVSCIQCFRAKRKIKPVPNQEPLDLGWQPIAGGEFMFEQTLKCLLLPNSGGVPTWSSDNESEQEMIKLPEQFRGLFASERGPLSEKHGEMIARWAAGDNISQASTEPALSPIYAETLTAIRECADLTALEELIPRMTEIKEQKLVPPAQYTELKAEWGKRKAEVSGG